MNIQPLSIPGAFRLEPDWHRDERGRFARAFCVAELAPHGIDTRVAQASISSNPRAGTLRGMHYAIAPSKESKVVRCVTGSVYDVILDLRRGTPTFGLWCSEELSRDNGRALVIPPGVAHGFLTLEADTDLFYQMSEEYNPTHAGGVRYDDLAFGVRWPGPPTVISPRDRDFPTFAP